MSSSYMLRRCKTGCKTGDTILLLCPLVLLVVGCATTSAPRGEIPSLLASHRITLGSASYLPSSILEKELHAQSRWDIEAQVWVLSVGIHEFRATPQMPVVLVDGIPQPLPAVPVMRQGQILLPEIAFTRWMAPWIPAAPPPPVPVRPHLRTIILDPGHGGHDPGAISRAGLREKSVVLDVALRLKELLQRDGFRVVMTREKDRFISLSGRSEIANREGADLFISVHANASRRRSISGYEVYYLSEATDDHARSLEAAENISLPEEVGKVAPRTAAIVWDLLYSEYREESRELAASVCQGLKNRRIPFQNRGVKTARFAVLKGARMPAVLVEIGFISHSQEEARLREAPYRQAIAEGVRNGIASFARSHERRS